MNQQSFDTTGRIKAKRLRTAQNGQPQKGLPGREVERRREKPSLWRHVFGMFAFLVAASALTLTYVEYFGDETDAIPSQDVRLGPIPQPAEADSLNGNSSALPDLLGEEVPLGVNPTEPIAQQPKFDALGNPIGNPNAITDGNVMAGETPVAATPPRTAAITVNGQVIGGGLVAAPVQGLTRVSPFGLLPARSSDGRTPFKVYARPFTASASAKPVSLIIGGLGINQALTRRAIEDLPADVTLSFAAHAPNLQRQINSARSSGHEVLLELPMESIDFDSAEPGANRALRSTGGDAQNQSNLDWLLSRASGYFAVTNYNGDLFLQRSDSVVPMMAALSDAGVGFVFDGSANAPSLPALASASRLPFLKAGSLIDSAPDSGSIKAELESIAGLGTSGAAPVGVGFTYPQTLDAVSEWITTLESRGLILAPVSSRMPPR